MLWVPFPVEKNFFSHLSIRSQTIDRGNPTCALGIISLARVPFALSRIQIE